jgi:hypothetical protein
LKKGNAVEVKVKRLTAAQKRKEAQRVVLEAKANEREQRDDLLLGPLWGLECRLRTLEDPEHCVTRFEEIQKVEEHYDKREEADAGDVARMCREIKDLEAEADRIAEEGRVLAARAKARADRARAVLFPVIERWAQTAQRTTKKGISFPNTTLRLQFRDGAGKVSISDKSRVLDWAAEEFGSLEDAEGQGVVKIRHDLSSTGLREWLEGTAQEQIDMETGETIQVLAHLPGATYEPAGERLSIVQRHKKKGSD